MCKWLGIFVMPIMYTSPLDHQVNIISSENYLFRVMIRYATIVTKQSRSLVNNIYLVCKHNKASLNHWLDTHDHITRRILLGQSSTKLTMWSNSSVYVWLRPITRRKSSSSNFSKFCKFTRRSHYLVLQSCQLFICGIMHVRLHARYLTLKTKCVHIDLKE